jgi:hypothetical protein
MGLVRPWLALAVVMTACGDLDADRVCENPPCMIPGRPSTECAAYIACEYQTGGVSPGALDSTYGSGGVCWSNTLAAAAACTAACKSALSSLRAADAGC